MGIDVFFDDKLFVILWYEEQDKFAGIPITALACQLISREVCRRYAARQLEAERKRLSRFRVAVSEIHAKCGSVCSGFEFCRHDSCRSSYMAWAIADAALKESS